MIVILILFVTASVVQWLTEKERVSKDFAENLFEYPYPAETKVISRDYFYGFSFNHLTGSGGAMPVVASVKLSTTLSRDEILNFYKDADLFHFPKGGNRGVELELYFEDEYQITNTEDGYYYSNKADGAVCVSEYFENVANQQSNKEESDDLQYVLQISSAFHYFLQLD